MRDDVAILATVHPEEDWSAMSTVLFLLVLTVFLAALGRGVTPRAERLPWRTWSWRDLVANVVRGARVLWESNQRQRDLWDAYLDDLQPWDGHPRHPRRARRHRDGDE